MWSASFFQSMPDCYIEHSPARKFWAVLDSWGAEFTNTSRKFNSICSEGSGESNMWHINTYNLCECEKCQTPRPDLQRFDVHSLKQVFCALHDLQRKLIGITLVIAGSQSVYVHVWLVVSTPPKYESQLGWLSPIYGKIKHVPNHQPNILYGFNLEM